MAEAFPIDHDLHCHSQLSSCSSDPEMTVAAIVAHAKANGYTTQCITDHLWDCTVPGASGWYAPQDIAHVRKNLPLPEVDGLRVVFGCETEYCGGTKLGLDKSHYDTFDFIVIPPNHFHMKDFVRPSSYDTEEKVAALFVERLESLTRLGLPWEKVGIAHMTCGLIFREGDVNRVFSLVDEHRFRKTMAFFAKVKAGIELNLSCFLPGWQKQEDAVLRLYRMAKEEGCRFYLGSDAHHLKGLSAIPQYAKEVVSLLRLTGENLYRIPQ